jgi:hypothetical protein
LKVFPYISTLDANYSPDLVGMLSQLATWQLLQLQQQLSSLLNGTNATLTRVATDSSSASGSAAGAGAGSSGKTATSDAVVRLSEFGKVLRWAVIFAAGVWVLAV